MVRLPVLLTQNAEIYDDCFYHSMSTVGSVVDLVPPMQVYHNDYHPTLLATRSL